MRRQIEFRVGRREQGSRGQSMVRAVDEGEVAGAGRPDGAAQAGAARQQADVAGGAADHDLAQLPQSPRKSSRHLR